MSRLVAGTNSWQAAVDDDGQKHAGRMPPRQGVFVGFFAVHGPRPVGRPLPVSCMLFPRKYALSKRPGGLLHALRTELARMQSPSPFDVLRVPPSASGEAVRTAFLTAAKKYHPTRFAREP